MNERKGWIVAFILLVVLIALHVGGISRQVREEENARKEQEKTEQKKINESKPEIPRVSVVRKEIDKIYGKNWENLKIVIDRDLYYSRVASTWTVDATINEKKFVYGDLALIKTNGEEYDGFFDDKIMKVTKYEDGKIYIYIKEPNKLRVEISCKFYSGDLEHGDHVDPIQLPVVALRAVPK